MSKEKSTFNKILAFLLGIGPGIFAIGYTIGTGSVTAMIKAGSSHGMQLLWVLALSCLFSWVLMEAYGRYYLVTGETALYSFRKRLKFGKLISISIIIGISFGQWNSLIGILGISANAIVETLVLFFPAIKGNEYWWVLFVGIIIIGLMYALLWKGKYSVFEKILLFFVTLMGLSFLVSLFVVLPDPVEVMNGFVPSIPEVKGGKMLVAAFVGTTMAAATFISRPLFIQGKAMAAFYHDGKPVTAVLDMVGALEPVAGKYAIALFFMGTLAAGLSSVFPILMITPLMIADYQQGKLDTSSKQFKMLTGIACIVGLAVPIFGATYSI